MHLLARDEIEELRAHLLCDAMDDETEARINVLCDMALSHLHRSLASVNADRAMSQALNEGDGSYKP